MPLAVGTFSIVPILAAVLSSVRFVLPTREVLAVRESRSLGELNPLPFATAILNTSGWMVYAVLVSNPWILLGDAPGMLASVWATLSLLPHAAKQTQDQLNFFMMLAAGCWSALALTTLLLNTYGAPAQTVVHLWGFAVSTTQVLLMASPLSTLIKAMRQRSSASFHAGLCIMGFVTSALWGVYAIVHDDLFILVPNVLGAALSLASILVLLFLPRAVPRTPAEQQQQSARAIEHAVELA